MSRPGTYCGRQSDLHGLDGSLAVPVKAQIGLPVIQSPKCGEDRSLCELCRQSTRFPGCGAAYRYRLDGQQQCDRSGLRGREDGETRCVAQEDSQQSCDGLACEGGRLFGAWGPVSMSSFGCRWTANFSDGARGARNRSQCPWPPKSSTSCWKRNSDRCKGFRSLHSFSANIIHSNTR
jgi:hypothetical protein